MKKALFKDKKDIAIFCFLLLVLILPRLLSYAAFGPGIVGTDAEFRYFPQVEELSKSFFSFFSQTGPLYTLFLLVFGKLTGSLVVLPVFLQHVLGVISALLFFYYFKKVNLPLAFVAVFFSFAVPMAVWLEHTVLREALVSFFLVVLILFSLSIAKNSKFFKFSFGLLAGFLAVLLVFLRIELAVLAILLPFILFFLKKRKSPAFKFSDTSFLKWLSGYFCPLLIVFLIYFFLPQKYQPVGEYGGFFSVAFYSLRADTFNYPKSNYPELLQSYQKIFKSPGEKAGSSISDLYKETENYLFSHPQIKLSVPQLMDRIYLEIIFKNTWLYSRSFLVNAKNHLVGIAELSSSVTKDEYKSATGIFLIDRLLLSFNILMIFLSRALFWLFLPAIPFFFKKWRTLPDEVVISFLIGAIHILVLAFFSNPAHRFRYALDPFIYFAQLYLIIIFLKALISEINKYSMKTWKTR